jgi:peptide/nickel transport system permease protein
MNSQTTSGGALGPAAGRADRRAPSVTRAVLVRFVRVRAVVVGGIGLGLVLLITVAGPLMIDAHPNAVDIGAAFTPPNLQHPLGTDDLGRDVLSRVVYGGRISFTAGFTAVALAASVGTVMGLVFGFYGGALDGIGMRVLDVMMAFPSLLLAMAVIAVLGPGLRNTVVAVGITFVPLIARMVRATVLRLASEEYVAAARAIGSSDARLLRRHLWPNVLPTIVVTSTLLFGWAVLSVSALSFIGVAVRPPTSEWGEMLASARPHMQTAWWVALGPGAALMLLILSVNALGDGLRQVLDPRLRY